MKEAPHANRMRRLEESIGPLARTRSEQVDDLMARCKVRPPKDWHNPDDNSSDGGSTVSDNQPKDAEGDASIGGPAGEH